MNMNSVLYYEFPLYMDSVETDDRNVKIVLLTNTTKKIDSFTIALGTQKYSFTYEGGYSQTITCPIGDSFSEPEFYSAIVEGEEILFNPKMDNIHVIKPRSVHSYGAERKYYQDCISKGLINTPPKSINYIAEDYKHYWNCTCGACNIKRTKCSRCGIDKDELFSIKPEIEEAAQERLLTSKQTISYFFLVLAAFAFHLFYSGIYGTPVFKNYLNNSAFGVFNLYGVCIIMLIVTLGMFLAGYFHERMLVRVGFFVDVAVLLYANILLIIKPVFISYAYVFYIGLDIATLFYYIYAFRIEGFKPIKIMVPLISLIGMVASIISMHHYKYLNIDIEKDGILLRCENTDAVNYEIEETINGIPVKEIYFSDQLEYSYQSIKLSKNLEKIEIAWASNLDTLVSFDINGNEHFYENHGVMYDKELNKPIFISNQVTDLTLNNEVIYKNGFNGCKNIKTLIIDDGVKVIEKNAFYNCVNLEEVVFKSKTLTTIESDSFGNCVKLKSLDIPKNVLSISQGAFSNCISIETVRLPFIGNQRANTDNLTNSKDFLCLIFGGPMYNYSSMVPSGLKSVTIYDVTRIHNVTFYDLQNVEEIIIENDLISLGINSFYNCKSIKSLVLKGSFDTIPANCFDGCESLESITIPSSVTTVEANAFRGCTHLNQVNYDGDFSKITIAVGNEALTNLK